MYTNINTKMLKTHESNLVFVPIQNFTKLSKIIQQQQQLSSSIRQWHTQYTNSLTCFQTSTTTIIHESIPSSSNHNFIIQHFFTKTQHIHTHDF